MTLYFNGHQSCSLSKFDGFYLLHRNGVFSNFQLWHVVTLTPLEVQGNVLSFWKPLINISWDLDCHGCCSTVTVCQAMLKNHILLNSLLYAFDLNWTELYVSCLQRKIFFVPWPSIFTAILTLSLRNYYMHCPE